MDIITQNLLAQFSEEHVLGNMSEDDRFERFAAFSMIRRHYSRSFLVDDVIVGKGGDTGIDAIALVVNNVLVTETAQIDDLADQNGFIDAAFIFVQAERTPSFDAAKLGSFGFGVMDFFQPAPAMPRNEGVQAASELAQHIFRKHVAILKPNPSCTLYYVTTGKWMDDANLVARREALRSDLAALDVFREVTVVCAGAEELRDAYASTRNVVTRTFDFGGRVDLPPTEGVNQAILGYVTLANFIKIVADDAGTQILSSIFHDNVRAFQEYNTVNKGMRDTLASQDRDRFILMNNGITIIARNVSNVGARYTITDYQIVNGCQTSNVIFDSRGEIGEDVHVPLRLIETRDEGVMDDVIEATNSQTDVKPDQYFARLKFSRGLEQHFAAIEEEHRLYYERRDGQYDRGPEPKTKIVAADKAIRAFAGIYLEEPHRTTRGYKTLLDKVGTEIYGRGHIFEPYYTAAFAHYKLERLFASKAIDAKYKPARYHILLAVRLLVDPDRPAQMNSHQMAERANKLRDALWDEAEALRLFQLAVALVEGVLEGDFDRDHIRTITVTNAILQGFGREAR